VILERFTSNWRSVAFAGGMAPPNQRTEFLDLANSPINFATPKMTHYCLPPSPKALVKFSVERRRPRRAVTAAAARFARPDTLQTTMRPTVPGPGGNTPSWPNMLISSRSASWRMTWPFRRVIMWTCSTSISRPVAESPGPRLSALKPDKGSGVLALHSQTSPDLITASSGSLNLKAQILIGGTQPGTGGECTGRAGYLTSQWAINRFTIIVIRSDDLGG
jgi:hypothetical protein